MDLAAAYRLCYRKGLCEGINNHLTVSSCLWDLFRHGGHGG